MNKLSILCLTALSALCGSHAGAAEVSEKFVVVHCESPGTLTLTEDALIAPNLKVTGDIDYRDFETLKYATISVTRTLDLSETVIHEYTSGDSGTRGDWMIGDADKITYPADMMPAGAFSEVRDNSISTFTRGSSTLSKIILPSSLKGFMKGAFTSYSIIRELEVPAGSTTLRQDGQLVYSYDGSTLLAMPPAYFGDITVAKSVTSVADGALDVARPASVTFSTVVPPTIPEGRTVSTAYIIAPDPQAYSEIFPDVDCIASLETITVTDLQPGTLMSTLGNMGYTRKDVRSVKLSGTLSIDDFNALVELPNIHAVDLSQATVECENISTDFRISNPSITSFQFPKFSKGMYLTIDSSSMLYGDLNVPRPTMGFYNYSKRFTSVILPATLYSLGDRTFPEYNVTETLDLSQCSEMTELKISYETQCLTTLRLPENLKTLKYIYGPIKEINLPASLQEIYGGSWMVEKLTLPASLQVCSLSSLPMVKEIDASAARSLYQFTSLSNAPNLKTLDLSMCPLNYFSMFGGVSTGGLVVSGGTRYRATNVRGIESVKLPSTIKELNAFADCPNLKEVDMMHCFRLTSIQGLINCPSLTSITLPESVKTIHGLRDCPALTSVKSAAAVPPTYSADKSGDDIVPLDFSKISLTVAKDCGGAYRMAEGWESCKSISDDAYRVSLSQYPLYSGVTNYAQLLLYGAGLYAPGATATLDGYPSGTFSLVGWQVNDEMIKSNPCTVTVNGPVSAVPDYALDSNLCEAVVKVSVPERQDIKLTIFSYQRVIYVDGKKFAEWKYTSSNQSTYTITLNAGEHEIAISSEMFTLSFDEIEETRSTERYSVTDLCLNSNNALLQLYPAYFDMDVLDLSGQSKLNYIYNRSANRIPRVNVSDCPELTGISLSNSAVEKFDFAGTPLTDIRLSYNSLKEFDLSDLPDLENLDLEYNQIKTLDITGLSKLRILDVSYNGLTDFVYGGNTALTTLYINNNALPALNLNDFPAMDYCLAYGQQLSMTIATDNLDTELLDDGNFDLSRASNWEAIWAGENGYSYGLPCTVEGTTVVIPAEAGRELTLTYDYLISPESDKWVYVRIELTRENFNSVDDLVAEGLVAVNGNRVTFADGIQGQIHTVSGVTVFNGTGESSPLPKGIYIVSVGSSVMKISIP